MVRSISALICAMLAAFPAVGCDITLPLRADMFAKLNAPVDHLTSLPGDAGAFEYLNEHHLDTIHLTHNGKTFEWTAKNTAATCGRKSEGRTCRVIAESETLFGKVTLTRERNGTAQQMRYRLLLVDGRRHVRVFPKPGASRTAAACNLMKSLDAFQRTWMNR